MRNIHCVCFPRSGHHLMMSGLFKYFERNPEFKDPFHYDLGRNYKSLFRAGPIVYCEYYTHCGKLPCPEGNFQKNHDFNLKTNQDERFMIIQYRKSAIKAALSFLEAKIKAKLIANTKKDRRQFFDKHMDFWYKWQKKWAFLVSKEVYTLPYEDFLSDPFERFFEVIHFVKPDEKVDQSLLSKVIENLNIVERRQFKLF